jgi:2-amino-4-hydroxy-6-hydroxymethyldihydropteridine diphosphokinase
MSVAYIGLGANLPSRAGSPEATLAAAVARLASLGRVVGCSSLYSTAPVGFADQPRFLNAVVGLETDRSPRELLEALLAVEREFGRDRGAGIANGPRPLDLDMLLYGDLVLSEYGLEVPHPRLAQRPFVLVPLSEIAPAVRDPRTGNTMQQLLDHFSRENASESVREDVAQIESHNWDAVARGLRAAASGSPRAGSGADPTHG